MNSTGEGGHNTSTHGTATSKEKVEEQRSFSFFVPIIDKMKEKVTDKSTVQWGR
jgi:hypothetical protein